jgi:transcriptional regulatory protein RtcR
MSKKTSARKTVVLGFVGTTLDDVGRSKRWERWRPTIGLTQQEDLAIDRLELLASPEGQELAQELVRDIAVTSPTTKVRVHLVKVADAWDFETVFALLDDFAGSYPFDVDQEDYLVHITTGSHVMQICLFLLCESRRIPAKLLQTSPTARPGGHARVARDARKQSRREAPTRSTTGSVNIIDLDLSKYDAFAKRFHRAHGERLSLLKAGIPTKNQAFNGLIERIEQVAMRSRAPILLLGATGAGKSQLAKRIFQLKKQSHAVPGDFCEVNCATIRGDAAQSMLFGHKRGAFTGATNDRDGMLKRADKGILFLDEIGELGLDEQAMLLRALESGAFLPLGTDRETQSNFQLLAGTNRDLVADVRAGTFREDLLARIDLWTFRMPCLAERPEDIEPNLDFELERISSSLGMTVRFNSEARRHYLQFALNYRWPGNFRTLAASVARMGTLAEGGRIGMPDVQKEVATLLERDDAGASHEGDHRRQGYAPLVSQVLPNVALDRFDQCQLEEVLAVCIESRTASEAGRLLFAHSRTQKQSSNDADRLRKYLASFGLVFADVQRSLADRETSNRRTSHASRKLAGR